MMKIAIPTAGGLLCAHFGHCQQFAIVEVDADKKEILKTEMVTPPMHEPGVLPRWLGELNCQLIIAGGMGARAITLFNQQGVGVVCGAPAKKPDEIVLEYLRGELITSGNLCDESSPGQGQGGGGNCGNRGRGF